MAEAAVAAADNITEDQAAVYDRQLRVWGHEVQQRLNGARVLVAGGDGLAAEVAKNLVLAGVGFVAVADDTPSSSAPAGNFLVTSEANPDSSVAEAMACTLQAMNPLVKVKVQKGSSSALDGTALADYQLVLATGLGLQQTGRLDEACRAAGKQLFVATVDGPLSWSFVDLQSHEFIVKPKDGKPPAGPVTLCYPSFRAALGAPLGAIPAKRRTHPLYPVLRVALAFEEKHSRRPGPGDARELEDLASSMEAAEKAGPHATQVDRDVLCTYAEFSGQEMPPLASIVGGLVANHAIRAIARVDEPIKSLLLVSLFDGHGVIEDLSVFGTAATA